MIFPDDTIDQPLTASDENATSYEDFHAANLADALTFLLLELRAPELVRQLMVALQGLLSGRSTVVRFKRSWLAVRMFKASNEWIDNEDLERMKNRVTNHLTMMQDWIHEEGLQAIIDYQPGTKTTDSRIRTSLFKWSVEIANAAGRRLHPDSSDDERRKVFIEEARRLVGKRMARGRKPTASRLKREPSAAARWKMAMTIAKATFDENRAKLKFSPEEIITFLCNELRRNLELHRLENPWCEMQQDGFDQTTEGTCSLENSRDGQIEGTQGGDSSVPATATAVADDDRLAIDSPPCVPSLPDQLELSDSARGLVQCTAGRAGDHWRALHAAASVGAVPVGIVRKDGELDRPYPEAVSDMAAFVKSFDGQVRRSVDARESLVLSLSDGVFQRDDCNADDAAKLSPFAWMVAETSPGSFHCWFRLAAAGESRADFHAALTAAGIGGNAGGTHSGRWPGSVNGKPERDGWLVRLVSVAPGRVASLEQVRAAFPAVAVADDAHQPPQTARIKKPVSTAIVKRSEKVRFPDYAKCLADHPHHSEQRPDRSAADASFIRLAADYHFTREEIFGELRRVSERFGSLPDRLAWREIDRIWSKFVRV
jgi:hypothetical protein